MFFSSFHYEYVVLTFQMSIKDNIFWLDLLICMLSISVLILFTSLIEIPASFGFWRNEQEQQRGRGRGFRPGPSGNQLSNDHSEQTGDSKVRDSSSNACPVIERGEAGQSDAVTGSLESLSINSGLEPRSNLLWYGAQALRLPQFYQNLPSLPLQIGGYLSPPLLVILRLLVKTQGLLPVLGRNHFLLYLVQVRAVNQKLHMD